MTQQIKNLVTQIKQAEMADLSKVAINLTVDLGLLLGVEFTDGYAEYKASVHKALSENSA